MNVIRFFALSTLLALSVAASAAVTVETPWVRATVAGQSSTGAFMKITATEDLRLTGVSSPVAGVALVHHMEMDSGVMKMRPDPSLNIPAGQTIELDPTGYHVMLMELTQELKQGSSVPITLTFKDGKGATQTVTVQAVVRPLNGNMKGM